MGLQVRSHQDFMHRGARQSAFASQGANTPATLSRRPLADTMLDPFPDLRTILARAPPRRASWSPSGPWVAKWRRHLLTVISGVTQGKLRQDATAKRGTC